MAMSRWGQELFSKSCGQVVCSVQLFKLKTIVLDIPLRMPASGPDQHAGGLESPPRALISTLWEPWRPLLDAPSVLDWEGT